MTKPVMNMEWLRKARELPFCLFVMSFVLLADAYCGAAGIAFSFESLERAALQHWILFGLSALAFYSFGSRVLQWVTLASLSEMGARRWIDGFLDSPYKRADEAERARGRVSLDQLRLFTMLHDNKCALALVEQHEKASTEEDRTERTHQHYAFCFLITLALGAVTQGPLVHAAWSSLSSHLIAASLTVAPLLLAALYIGVIRGLTWRRETMVRLPGHEALGVPGVPPKQSAMPHWLIGQGGPKPSAADIAHHKHAAFRSDHH